MKQLWNILIGILRELSDETAYARHLEVQPEAPAPRVEKGDWRRRKQQL